MDNFDRCQKFVKQAEGGANFTVVNGKPVLKPKARKDKGGFTKYGITHGALSKAYAQGIVDHNDIIRLTMDEALLIYRQNYWILSRAERLDWGLCLIHYDTAVNSGVGGAAKLLQRSINEIAGKYGVKPVSIDAIVGQETLGAAKALPSGPLCESYMASRRALYHAIVARSPGQGENLNGWLKRLERLRRFLDHE